MEILAISLNSTEVTKSQFSISADELANVTGIDVSLDLSSRG